MPGMPHTKTEMHFSVVLEKYCRTVILLYLNLRQIGRATIIVIVEFGRERRFISE